VVRNDWAVRGDGDLEYTARWSEGDGCASYEKSPAHVHGGEGKRETDTIRDRNGLLVLGGGRGLAYPRQAVRGSIAEREEKGAQKRCKNSATKKKKKRKKKSKSLW